MAAKGYRDLVVWQKSMSLVAGIYSATKKFPKEEIYTLTSQIRRSAISIPSNIAEGSSKYSNKEFLRFLAIARGSVAELETQLLISKDLAYIPTTEIESLIENTSEVARMLNGLLAKLKAAND